MLVPPPFRSPSLNAHLPCRIACLLVCKYLGGPLYPQDLELQNRGASPL